MLVPDQKNPNPSTSVSHLSHFCLTAVSHLACVCLKSVSRLSHICPMSLTHQFHICLTSVSNLSHICLTFVLFTAGAWNSVGSLAEQEHGERDRAPQQDSGVERWHSVVCAELPWQGHSSLGEEFPDHSWQWPWVQKSLSTNNYIREVLVSETPPGL